MPVTELLDGGPEMCFCVAVPLGVPHIPNSDDHFPLGDLIFIKVESVLKHLRCSLPVDHGRRVVRVLGAGEKGAFRSVSDLIDVSAGTEPGSEEASVKGRMEDVHPEGVVAEWNHGLYLRIVILNW